MATEAEIKQRIAEEQVKIDVPSYQDVAWDGAWKRRAGAMWGIGALGLITGAGIGLIAPLFPAVAAGTALTGALIAKSVAVFSAIGITTGFTAGAVMGTSAGAAAGAMKEYERRTLARDIEDAIRDNPDATVKLGEKVLPERGPIGISGYMNFRTGALFTLLGAAAGLVFATALSMTTGGVGAIPLFAMPAMEMMLGAGVSGAAATAYTVGLGASFGAIFGINYSRISRNFTNLANELLSGKAINADWPPAANLPDLKPILSPVVHKPLQPEDMVVEPKTKFAEKRDKAQDYKTLVERSIEEANRAPQR